MPTWRILLPVNKSSSSCGQAGKRQSAAVIILAALCLFIFILCIGTGSVFISPGDALRILAWKLFGAGDVSDISASAISILWDIRMPRVAAAFLSGGALSLSGAVMQTILQNPLASSYTLGVSSGASLGAALVIVSGISVPVLGHLLLPAAGFAFGLLTIAAVIAISSRISNSLQSHTVILMGMAVSLFVNAMQTLVSSFAGEHAQQLVLWQMGSFSGMRWYHAAILLPVCALGLLVLCTHARELDILSFGDENALSLGVSVRRTKLLTLAAATLLTGAAVCFTGTIGFVDLIAPHAVRRIFGSSSRRVLPLSFLAGGAFMALCDMISRTILSPRELPVGAVTALVGTPFFIGLYVKSGKKEGGY